MEQLMQYDTVEVIKDINPSIKAGMVGLVMDVYGSDAEVMFTSDTGMTYSFEGETSFLISQSLLMIPAVA